MLPITLYSCNPSTLEATISRQVILTTGRKEESPIQQTGGLIATATIMTKLGPFLTKLFIISKLTISPYFVTDNRQSTQNRNVY